MGRNETVREVGLVPASGVVTHVRSREEGRQLTTKGDVSSGKEMTGHGIHAARSAAASHAAAGNFGPYLTREEARAVLGRLPPTGMLGTLCRFLWQAGPRIAEAIGVTAGDVDFGLGTVRVQTLKRRGGAVVYRWVPIQPDLQGMLAQRVAFKGLKRSDRIWPRSKRQYQRLISKAMLDAGVAPEKAHSHAWRHGLAVNSITSGVPLTVVQEQLGHASIVTTSLYCKMTLADRKAAMLKVDFT